MASENYTVTKNGLTSSQLPLEDNCRPDPLTEDSIQTDSPLSVPRHSPKNESLPEILITDYSPSKVGLDSTSLLDWSVSCTSVSAASSDLPQNGSVQKSDEENAESSVEESVNKNRDISPRPKLTDTLPGEPQQLDSSSSTPLSFLTASSSTQPPNHVTSLNGVAAEDDFPSLGGFHRESSEPPGGESDEEYFEEFHLPNTHENAFVRHLSFRRKVQTTPIHAPDAERIEGLVRTGEFVRHGSIRKKILPEEPLQEHYEEEEDLDGQESKNDSSFTRRIERDLREIERYLSEDNLADTSNDGRYEDPVEEDAPANKLSRTTSTPISKPTSTSYRRHSDDVNEDMPRFSAEEEPNMEVPLDSQSNFEEHTNIEESTIRKIQECLDFSAYRDMLNLSGRLSDILSPMEVEEVLSHSERYRHYLDSEVIEALSLSFKSQSQSLPYSINTTTSPSRDNNSANRVATSQGTSPVTGQIMPSTDSEFSTRIPTEMEDALQGVTPPPEDDLLEVRRNSVAFDGIGAPGIFVEATPKANSDMRRISAPRINLDWSADSKRDSTSDGESFHVESAEEEPTSSSRKRIHVSRDVILNDSDTHDEFVTVASEAIEHDIAAHIPFSSATTELPPEDISPAPPPPDLIPELTTAEEFSEMRHWRNVVIGGAWRRIDMKVIAPYRKCVSHGGYMEDSQSPIVVLSAALLPDRSRKDYHYVMDNLFIYVLSFLEQLVADDYVLVYFSEDLNQRSAPGFHWLRRAYQMIDRRLRKNLKALLLVHPSLWARTILTLSRPFVSSKFYRKLHYVRHLIDLAQLVPLEQLEIPDVVKQADFEIMIREKKHGKTRR